MAPALDSRRLGRTVADGQDAALARRQYAPAAGRMARIDAAVAQRVRAHKKRSLRAPVVAGAALCAAAAVALLRPSRKPLRFEVGEPSVPGLVGVWIAPPPERPTPVAFSDGSRIVVGSGGRARVAEVSDRGARVVVERGAVHADVVPRPGNDWSVIGGPFEIHVVGTEFDATWDPAREELSIAMHHGRVVVRGPCLTTERAFAGGESGTVSCAPVARDASSAAPVAPAPATTEPPRGPPPGAPEIPERPRPAPSSRAARPATTGGPIPSAIPAPPPSWRDLRRRRPVPGGARCSRVPGLRASLRGASPRAT